MPGYASIVNYLLRLFPNGAGGALYKAVVKLSPQAENLADPALTQAALRENLSAWHTRAAVEALRGWKWPYWINAQFCPASASFTGAPFQPVLVNMVSRDATLIPGLPGRFAGTMDRRGMITPAGARFSIEVWFRVGEKIIFPAELLDENGMSFEVAEDSFRATFVVDNQSFFISATAQIVDGFGFLKVRAGVNRGLGTVESVGHDAIAVYVAIRPYNLESVAPIHDLVYNSKGFWMCENRIIGWFSSRPDISWASDARHGDAALFILAPPERTAVSCPAGMATAVSAWHFPRNSDANESGIVAEAEIVVPLEPAYPREFPFVELGGSVGSRKATVVKLPATENLEVQTSSVTEWSLSRESLRELVCAADVAAPEIQNLLLHRNLWLTAAVRALLANWERQAAGRLLGYCALAIQKNGYLPAGHNNWSFQGQFLTALADYYRIPGVAADETILRYSQIKSAGRWIMRKRREVSHSPTKPRGLLPPSLTRDGIGTEFQLADNLWALEGLEAAKDLARMFGEHTDAETFHNDAVKYAAQISAAIHRELEYGITQQVPGRLHRAFDAAGAADLLDIALTDEARTLLKPIDWMPRLIETLAESPPEATKTESGFDLLRMDERGLRPARRLMLHLAHYTVHGTWRPDIQDLHQLVTPMRAWTECLHPRTRSGCGRLFYDPEAAALYMILMERMDKTKSTVNNRET